MDKIIKVRESNIELLRLLLIIFVIVLHYNGETCNVITLTENAKLSVKYLVRICEVFCLCSVNTFLIISGFFLCSKKSINIRKVFDLFTIVILFSLTVYILEIIFGISEIKIKSILGCFLPSNYYVYLYSAVFILSPFLNLVTKLEKKKFNIFILIILILFSVFPTIIDFISNYIPQLNSNGRSFISLKGNGGGYTFVNFVLLYYCGAFIKINEITLSGIKACILYIISSIVIFLGTIINNKYAFDYCNLFLITQASFLFFTFRSFSLKNKIINYIAKSVWGIFILHFDILGIILNFIDINKICNYSLPLFLLSSVIIIVVTFLSSLLLDIILRIVIKPINKLLDNLSLVNKEIQIETETEVKK